MMLARPRRTREVTGSQPYSVAIIAKPIKYTAQVAKNILADTNMEQQRIEELNKIVQQQKLTDLKSNWETVTNNRIFQNNVKSKVSQMKMVRDANLDARRERLRQLLVEEEERYLTEFASKEETQLERQVKLRDKARLLREKRETERRALAEEKLDLQFRLQCEELRSCQTKRNQDIVASERILQIQDKKERKKEENVMEKLYEDLWNADIAAKTRREDEDERKRLAGNSGMLDTLRQQMAYLEQQKSAEKQIKQEEAKLMEEERQLRKIEEERAYNDKLENQRKTREMLQKSIQLKGRRNARAMQEELAFDMKQLEELLEASKNEMKEQRNRKNRLREEDAIYRQYLQQIKEAQVIEEREIEKVCNEQIEEAYRKQTEQRRIEREARKKLLDQVIAGRREQINRRHLIFAQEKQEALLEKERVIKMIEENKLKELQENRRIIEKEKFYQNDLIGQIGYNQRQRQLINDEENRIEQIQSAAEREYRNKIEYALQEFSDPHIHPMRKALSASNNRRNRVHFA